MIVFCLCAVPAPAIDYKNLTLVKWAVLGIFNVYLWIKLVKLLYSIFLVAELSVCKSSTMTPLSILP